MAVGLWIGGILGRWSAVMLKGLMLLEVAGALVGYEGAQEAA
jgi:hypothetical protein